MLSDADKTKCTGCGACSNACPKRCIKMLPDEKGFLYPFVDRSLCIKCGLCEKVCPALNAKAFNGLKIAYASYCLEDNARLVGSSGGLFGVLARETIRRGGIVIGASWNEDCKGVRHVAANDESELKALYSSKYLQSDAGESYKAVRSALEEGRYVLFSGTSCQVNALKLFLGKDYQNLLTIDVICHGVPSPKVWSDYVSQKEAEYGANVVHAAFRNKRFGWQRSVLLLLLSDGREYCRLQSEDEYVRGFLANLYLRPSCYECKCKGEHVSSDITLGDFWGIERLMPGLNVDKGVSAVILNTDKGRSFFDGIKDKLFCGEVSYQDVVLGNPSLVRPCAKPKKSDLFWKFYKSKGLDVALKRSLKVSFVSRCKRFSYKAIRKVGRPIKRFIMKLKRKERK